MHDGREGGLLTIMEDSHLNTIHYAYGSTSTRNDRYDGVVGLPESEGEGPHPEHHGRHYQSCPNSALLSSIHHQPPRSSAGAENGDDEGSSLLTDFGTQDVAAGHHRGSSKKNSVIIASLAIVACAFVWLAAVPYLSSEKTEPLGSPTGITVDPPPSVPLLGAEDGLKELAAEEQIEGKQQQQYYGGGGGEGNKFPFIKRHAGVVLRMQGVDDSADGSTDSSDHDMLYKCGDQCAGDYQCNEKYDCPHCTNYDSNGYGECCHCPGCVRRC